ncbi:MAG: serine hydrolase domain-containing protein [Bacteroidota bacterium]
MNWKTFYSILLLVGVFTTTTFLQAQITDSIQIRIQQVENGLSPLVQKEGQELWNIEDQMRKYNIPGLSVAVINNYQVEWSKAYGKINNGEASKVTTQTVFQAASISKFVNAVAILKLKELKGISLDEDINTQLSSWKVPYDKSISDEVITLRKILSHTAGLSVHGFGGYKTAKKLPTILEILDGESPANSPKVKPIIPPMQEFKYSGGGTTVSQLALSELSGASYEDFVHENVLGPTQMNESFYSTEFEKYPKEVSNGHTQNGKPLKNGYNLYPESAAAGLWTTSNDLAKLITHLQLSLANDKRGILTKSSIEELMTPMLKNNNAALGVFVEDQNGEKYIQHSGSNRGFRGKFYFGANNGKGVVIMINGTNTNIIDQIIRSVASVYNWKGFNKLAVKPNLDLSELDYKKYMGTYTFGKRSVSVIYKNGKLQIAEKKKWSSILTPLNESTFVANALSPRATMEFISDNEGKVIKMIVNQGGVLEWKKVE